MNRHSIRGTAAAALLLAAVAASASAQDRITLKESVELVLRASRPVEMAREAAAGAELKIKESRSQYWPQASLAGNYTRMSLFGEFTIPFNGQMMTIKFGTPNNYNFRGSISEQVFNWGRTARTVDMSLAGLDLANDGVAMTRTALSYQVVPIFYGTVFFKSAIQALDDNLQAFRRKLDILSRRYEAGLASSFDKNLVQVQISSLEAQKVDFQNAIVKFRLAFNSLAGRPADQPFEPAAELAFQPADPKLDALLQEALANRLEFRQIEHQNALNRAALGLAKTGDKPTVAASFNYEFRNGFMPEMDKIKGNWTALLSVSYPLFDGFRVKTQVAEAESALRASEMRKAEQERQVVLEIQTALAELRALESKYEIEQVKIRQAELTLKIAEDRYQSGLLSATDLVDAQNTLESARLNALQIAYNHVMGLYNLYRSCGRTL